METHCCDRDITVISILSLVKDFLPLDHSKKVMVKVQLEVSSAQTRVPNKLLHALKFAVMELIWNAILICYTYGISTGHES